MKKIAKKIIIAVLVLSMTLGIFAGCQNPTENKSLAEKYGITMSDKTATYDGEKHGLAISIDNTILQGKSYEVTYDVNGTVVTKVEFSDAGEYNVTAKVKVAGDETVYPLTKKLTINKADLSLEIGNLFLRQLQNIAYLGNPRDLFKDAKFIGKDTVAILGTLSFEVFNGGSKVTDLSTLKPTEKLASALTVKVAGLKDLTNYDVKIADGKLYVLAGAEYDNAKLLKEEIATVPTTTTINTLDYSAMRAFAQGADHIVEAYPSTNEIQRLMCGTVDVNTVKTLKKTADTRVANVYDFDDEMESAVGKVVYLGAAHDKNEMRNSDDKLTELKNSLQARQRGEYGDLLAFEVVIYNTEKYNFTHVLINGVEFTTGSSGVSYAGEIPAGVTAKNSKVYSFGKVAYTTEVPAGSYSYGLGVAGNPGAIDGVRISKEMLGALTGKTSLTIEVVAGEVHEAGIYNGVTEVVNSTGSTDEKTYSQMSDFTISSKGEDYYKWTTNTTEKKANLVVGNVYKFTITTKPGYGVVSVDIGDKIILASAMENGSFTIKLTEDHLAEIGKESIVKIVPTFERVFSFEVKTNVVGQTYRTLSHSDRDGVFTNDAGIIKLIGVSQTLVPTIPEEKSLTLSIVPTTGWMIADVFVEQTATNQSVKITDEFDGSSVSSLDFADTKFKGFSSKELVTIKVKLRETFPIVVKSIFDDKTTNMTMKSDGSYVSEYGTVEVINTKKDALTVLAKDGSYYIRLINKEGYVPKSIKIDGRQVVGTAVSGTLSEGVRYPMIKNGTNILINSFSAEITSYKAVAEDSTTSFEKDKNHPLIVESKINAGENFVIEVEYEAYYFVSVSNELPSDAKFAIDFGMLLTPKADSKEYTQSDGVDGIGEVFLNTSPLIKVAGSTKEYYCYYGEKNITAKILASEHDIETAYPNDTNKYVDPMITIGCDGSLFSTSSSARSYKIAVSDAVKVPPTIDKDVAKRVSKVTIAPGKIIEIKLIVDGYEPKPVKS